MSTLSQFAPFAGGGLKSFQTGFFQSGSTNGGVAYSSEDVSYNDVTVSSVNTSKAITAFEGSMRAFDSLGGYQAYSAGGGYWWGVITSRMTSATNLRLASVVWSTPAISGRWKIAEAN
jgi:hypothetical protein